MFHYQDRASAKRRLPHYFVILWIGSWAYCIPNFGQLHSPHHVPLKITLTPYIFGVSHKISPWRPGASSRSHNSDQPYRVGLNRKPHLSARSFLASSYGIWKNTSRTRSLRIQSTIYTPTGEIVDLLRFYGIITRPYFSIRLKPTNVVY